MLTYADVRGIRTNSMFQGIIVGSFTVFGNGKTQIKVKMKAGNWQSQNLL